LCLLGALNAATSFLVWLFSTSFQDRLTSRFGRTFYTGSPALSLSEEEDSLSEEGEDASVEEDILLSEGSGGDGEASSWEEEGC
jgi:hypothetical protein